MKRMDVCSRYYFFNKFYYLFVVYLTKVTSFCLHNQFEKSVSSCFVYKVILTENVYVSLSGAAEEGKGSFKTGISSHRKNSSRLLRRSL